MKTQIRYCTFETNSSTNHTLCIAKQDKVPEYYKGAISIPSITEENLSEYERMGYDDSILSDYNLETRVNLVVLSTMSDDTGSFIFVMKKLSNILTAVGYHVNIDWDSLFLISDCGIYWGYGLFDIMKGMSDDEISHFLFSDDVRYAAYCDECCSAPSKEYEDLMNHIEELDSKKTIIFHDRS